MSVYPPKLSPSMLPVEAVAAPLTAFTVTPDILAHAEHQDTLIALVLKQWVVPLITPHGYLEGVLTDTALLSQNAVEHAFYPFTQMPGDVTAHHESDRLHFQVTVLLQEARRCTVSLRRLQTVQDAQTLLYKTHYPFIPIVDDDNLYTGTAVSRQQLLDLMRQKATPLRVGGMATPLGVYLTTGKLTAGAGWQGLMLGGALFACFTMVMEWLYPVFYSAVYAFVPDIAAQSEPVSSVIAFTLEYGFLLGALLAGIRFSPISGLHAAEHMTVNAIEAGLPLNEENVARQSRIHGRCGTNLVIYLVVGQGALLYCDLMHRYVSFWAEMLYLSVIGFILWKWGKPLGAWLQGNWTTKQPTAAQLQSGINAGKALIEKYEEHPHAQVTLGQRIWSSGLLQVLVAFIIVNAIGELLLRQLFH